jgi:asparaginyl-tRNA synthetase
VTYIKDLIALEGQTVSLKGWLSNARESKGVAFLIMRDGTGMVQCVVGEEKLGAEQFAVAQSLTQESSFEITGTVRKDERQIGGVEVQVDTIKAIQVAEEYPISNKPHGIEFLMDNRHLWLRHRRPWATMRIRNQVIHSIHNFFQKEGFVHTDTPIFTGNAVEGTSTLFETDFYGQPAYLAQSGQLYGEALAMALGKIYTFGPTFRAEKSKTRRHLSEFWMIEPEMAFFDLKMNMDLIEQFIQYVVAEVLAKCRDELAVLERDTASLEKVNQPFARITYDEAVAIIRGEKQVGGTTSLQVLQEELEVINLRIGDCQKEISEREAKISAGGLKKGEVNFNQNKIDQLKNEVDELTIKAGNIPQWIESAKNFQHGNDFGGSDETAITRLFETPVMVYNWPAEIKAFYMKRDEQNPALAKGVDVLAPEGFGEIVGGSERESDRDVLIQRIQEHNLPMDAFGWYIDLRRFGSVPHAGFGLGLERFVGWICNLQHVRETIPFARMYGRLFP